MSESVEVKLARIEEGLVAIRGDMKTAREESKEFLVGLKKEIKDQEKDISNLKRDRFWIAGIFGTFLTWMLKGHSG